MRMVASVTPRMDPQSTILVFTLDRRQFAIRAHAVTQVVRAVAVTPATDTNGLLLGTVNVRGQEIQALSLREYLGLPERALDPSQRFILVRLDQRAAALLVDEVESVIPLPPGQLSSAERLLPAFSHIGGIARLDSGVLLIEDLSPLLASAEACAPAPSNPA